jgi:uncharacterized protein
MPTPTEHAAPLSDADLARLQELLDTVPEPLDPLDVMAIDGFLCGVVLQPAPPPPAAWLHTLTDIDGRPLPAGFAVGELHGLVQRRHAELERAITQRQWFDPWVFELDDDATPSQALLPWVAGFATAMDLFPALMALEHPELVEPLALLYMHFDAEDLEDADALTAVIETLEPPADLAEAVQDTVRSLMLIADITRPQPAARRPFQRATRPGTRPGAQPRPGQRRPRR